MTEWDAEHDLIEGQKAAVQASPVNPDQALYCDPRVKVSILDDKPVEIDGRIFLGVAEDDEEASLYFRPFMAQNPDVSRLTSARCGQKTSKCLNCGHQYRKREKLLLRCPDCSKDRRCWRKVKILGDQCAVHRARASTEIKLRRKDIRARESQLPEEHRQRWRTAVKSIDFKDLLPEAALVESRLQSMLGGLAEGESQSVLTSLGALVHKYDEAPDSVEGDKQRVNLRNEIFEKLREGATEAELWDDALRLNQQIADLKKSQSVIEANRKSHLTAPEALRYAEVLADATMEALAMVRQQWLLVASLVERQELTRVAENIAVRLLESEQLRQNTPVSSGLACFLKQDNAVNIAQEVTESALLDWQRNVPAAGMSKALIDARELVAERIASVARIE